VQYRVNEGCDSGGCREARVIRTKKEENKSEEDGGL
jgi:hypothetical protein